MSLKRFMGWEPAVVVDHEYDEAGRLVRSVETTETEWDVEQRSWMQALAELAYQSCSGCGGFLQETLDPELEYVTEHPLRCHRCEALEIRRDQIREKARHPGSFAIWPIHERRL